LLRERMQDGFVFRKYNVRGKVFIEYVPAEHAWAPVVAPNHTFIHCFWVSGRFKGQGLGKELLQSCIDDSSGKDGVVVISTAKPKPFLTDKRFFAKHGFEVVDTAPPFYELLALRLNPDAPPPRFAESLQTAQPVSDSGLVVYYSNLCPFTEYYVDETLETAREHGIEARKVKVTSAEEAQRLPTPTAVFGVFLDGEFLTHELLNRGRLEKLLATIGRI
ncbi:MAG: GNAT family N-acetyltransferase, partial [Spirochaetota bacterium]